MENKFNENHTIKYFNTLRISFWDNQETEEKNYNALQKIEPYISNENLMSDLNISHKIMTDKSLRNSYKNFLFVNYILSQPFSLAQLEHYFHNKIFPFYLFTIIDKGTSQILIIDYINLHILIYTKGEKNPKELHANSINSLFKTEDAIFINTSPQTINKSTVSVFTSIKIPSTKIIKEQFILIPEFQEQLNLIYVLIEYLHKFNSELASMKPGNNKETKAHKTFNTLHKTNFNLNTSISDFLLDANYCENIQLMQDDAYIPSGIILQTNKVTLQGKIKCYLVLGARQIIIFKDNSLKEIITAIPIVPLHIIIRFQDSFSIIKLTLFSRVITLTFSNVDEYTIWKSTLINVAEHKLLEKIDDKSLVLITLNNCPCPETIHVIDQELSALKNELQKLKNIQHGQKNQYTDSQVSLRNIYINSLKK
jgi:hypothetical protein